MKPSYCVSVHGPGRVGVGQCPPWGDNAPFSQALSNQQKAVLMSERVMGIEHPNTIQEYVSSHGRWGLCR